ncbi:hypothetical protein [Staphylococcus epidermidis]|uniref:hypothetical protein n=1 Tax=Staphylococcus epidermidis TaxID=1282 RepID=UPI000299333D|nr:hypothetical protein [Staphylococcus epidermidis]EKS24409.1 hypothetical protein HMPREF9281_02401 [Staphylococcus epidermidis BVS058A4]
MRETYFDYKQESLDALAKMDKATRKELLEWCEKSFKPIKSINKKSTTSYGLKHLFERDEETKASYVSNEEFRGAMIKLGFEHTDDVNMYFNISQKSVNNLRRRIDNVII